MRFILLRDPISKKKNKREARMVGPNRPQIVLFGSSVVQMCYNVGGWGAILADLYARKSLSDNTRILCLSSPPIDEVKIREIFGNALDDQARTNEGCRIYTEALIDLCREMDVEAINLWTAIQQKEDWAKTSFIDGIHLSADGSKVVVKEVLKLLKDVDWKPSLYWLSMESEFPEDSPHYVVGPDGKSTFNVTSHICTWQREWLDI